MLRSLLAALLSAYGLARECADGVCGQRPAEVPRAQLDRCRMPSVPVTTSPWHRADWFADIESNGVVRENRPPTSRCTTADHSSPAPAIRSNDLPVFRGLRSRSLDDLEARHPRFALRSRRPCGTGGAGGPRQRSPRARRQIDELQCLVPDLLRGDRARTKLRFSDAVRRQNRLRHRRHAGAAQGHEQCAAGDYESRRGAANTPTHEVLPSTTFGCY